MAAWLNRWLFISILPVCFCKGAKTNRDLFLPYKLHGSHPFHVSVVEIDHNAAEKTLEISCKIFTDDFEKALTQNYKMKVDLINPPVKRAMDTLVKSYISLHLSLNADGKKLNLIYVGFEHENDAVYGYFEVDNIPSLKKITITNRVMYDFFTDQVNLMHVIVDGKRQSTKLDYPDAEATISF